MRIFNELKDSIPRNKLKPTRNWKIKQTQQQNILDLYVENVLNYKLDAMRTAKKYQHEEIGKILALSSKFNNQSSQHLSDYDHGFTFEYDLVEPKARFYFSSIF